MSFLSQNCLIVIELCRDVTLKWLERICLSGGGGRLDLAICDYVKKIIREELIYAL